MRRSVILLLLGVSVPGVAAATVEVTANLGYRGGTASLDVLAEPVNLACLVEPCFMVAKAESKASEVYGVTFDASITPRWMLEALIDRQPGELRLAETLAVPEGSSFYPDRGSAVSFDSTTFHLGVLRDWEVRRMLPFVAVGVGMTRLESPARAGESDLRILIAPPPAVTARVIDEDLASGSVAGGVRVPVGEHLGARFEGRGYWTDLPRHLGGDLFQTQVTAGITFRR
jgi:hypothetical protein